MKHIYEFAVVTEEGAFVLSGDERLHIYGSAKAADLFIKFYAGSERLRVRRISVESPWNPPSLRLVSRRAVREEKQA